MTLLKLRGGIIARHVAVLYLYEIFLEGPDFEQLDQELYEWRNTVELLTEKDGHGHLQDSPVGSRLHALPQRGAPQQT